MLKKAHLRQEQGGNRRLVGRVCCYSEKRWCGGSDQGDSSEYDEKWSDYGILR